MPFDRVAHALRPDNRANIEAATWPVLALEKIDQEPWMSARRVILQFTVIFGVVSLCLAGRSASAKDSASDPLPVIKAQSDKLLGRTYDDATMRRLGFDRAQASKLSDFKSGAARALNCGYRPASDVGKSSDEHVRHDAISYSLVHQKENPRKFSRSERIVICDNVFILGDEEMRAEFEKRNTTHRAPRSPAVR